MLVQSVFDINCNTLKSIKTAAYISMYVNVLQGKDLAIIYLVNPETTQDNLRLCWFRLILCNQLSLLGS